MNEIKKEQECVLENHTQDWFVDIPNWLFEDVRLTSDEKIVLFRVCYNQLHEKEVVYTDLHKVLNISIELMNVHLRSLVSKGFLTEELKTTFSYWG